MKRAVSRLVVSVAIGIGLVDFVLLVLVVVRRPYTEIDWIAYMEQVKQAFENNERDYARIHGRTGPLVYPAGFLWIYYLLYRWTNGGTLRTRAQVAFAALHALGVALTCAVYQIATLDLDMERDRPSVAKPQRSARFLAPTSIGLIAALLVALSSRRVASIFVLRLFNDGVESVLMQASVLFFVIARSRSHSGQHIRHQWLMDVIACLLYSMAVSVKMNALLYAPAVLVLLWEAHGFLQTLIYLVGVCGSWQLVIGWRFLRQHPWSYLRKAFEFGRVFDQRWSVNFACLPEHVFVHPCWAALLLTLHVLALALFGVRAGVPLWLRCRPSENAESRVNAFRTALLLWSSNLIGMAFARSLHYQFLAWVWWSSPFIALADWMMAVELFRPRVDLMTIGWRLVPVLLIELVFNRYPPKCWASVVLHIAHACLLVRVWATVARWRRRDEQTPQRRPVYVQPRPGMDDERQSMYVPERAAAERRQRLGVAATK